MSGATVHLVDDDASFLRAACRMLRRSGFQVVSHASARELMEALGPASTGCVVADLNMPEMDGLDLQEALRNSGNPLPVVFLTGQGDIPVSVKAMRRGAEDFLTKHAPRERLVEAIRRALSRDAREREVRERRSALRARFGVLSPRELEVLLHVVQGKLNKQIADDLGINERTVKLHRTAITTKLGVPSVAELTALWIEADKPGASCATGSTPERPAPAP